MRQASSPRHDRWGTTGKVALYCLYSLMRERIGAQLKVHDQRARQRLARRTRTWERLCLQCTLAFGCRRSPTGSCPSSRCSDHRCGRPRLWRKSPWERDARFDDLPVCHRVRSFSMSVKSRPYLAGYCLRRREEDREKRPGLSRATSVSSPRAIAGCCQWSGSPEKALRPDGQSCLDSL